MGGENSRASPVTSVMKGSSPRGRGKRVLALGLRRAGGLIPAWAGKTDDTGGESRTIKAHPRVGGENAFSSSSCGVLLGSSPRGRGKPGGGAFTCGWHGLIPAWAGKTA